ncbi:hypothetical protein R6Q59_008375 [Mikania micrantha]
MMNGPFFRNYSNQQPSRSPRSVPVQRTQQKSSPKVVSVPIHFVSSDQPRTTMFMLKDSAARKIQKVFKGFVVRKSVRKIASIRREVSEIERRIEDTESVNLIRRDEKERLRVTETLMSLLFKLDSIRGVDCGIRDLRKAVTRKAIALQEKVDSIAQINNQTLDSSDHDSGEIDLVSSVACTSTSDQVTEASNSLDEMVNNLKSNDDDEDVSVVKEVVEEDVKNSSCDIKAADVTGEVEAMEASPAVNTSESGEEDDPSTMDLQNHHENREIVEKLMDDNEKLMKVMSQISERNEMQSRMINLLSKRVERLEKTLISDRQRKKKKARVSLRRRGRDEDIFSVFS